MATDTDLLTAALAEALFASDLSASACHTHASVEAAIRRAIRAHGSIRGCAGEVAAAYGEHPETAAPRMRWARAVVEDTFALPAGNPAPWQPPGSAPLRRIPRLPAGASAGHQIACGADLLALAKRSGEPA